MGKFKKIKIISFTTAALLTGVVITTKVTALNQPAIVQADIQLTPQEQANIPSQLANFGPITSMVSQRQIYTIRYDNGQYCDGNDIPMSPAYDGTVYYDKTTDPNKGYQPIPNVKLFQSPGFGIVQQDSTPNTECGDFNKVTGEDGKIYYRFPNTTQESTYGQFYYIRAADLTPENMVTTIFYNLNPQSHYGLSYNTAATDPKWPLNFFYDPTTGDNIIKATDPNGTTSNQILSGFFHDALKARLEQGTANHSQAITPTMARVVQLGSKPVIDQDIQLGITMENQFFFVDYSGDINIVDKNAQPSTPPIVTTPQTPAKPTNLSKPNIPVATQSIDLYYYNQTGTANVDHDLTPVFTSLNTDPAYYRTGANADGSFNGVYNSLAPSEYWHLNTKDKYNNPYYTGFDLNQNDGFNYDQVALALITDANGKPILDKNGKKQFTTFAYHVAAIDPSKAAGKWVLATDVKATNTYNYTEDATGTVVAAKQSNVYSDRSFADPYKGRQIANGEKFNYTLVVKDSLTNAIKGYGRKDQAGKWEYIQAADVKADTSADATIKPENRHVFTTGTTTIYSDPAATVDSGSTVAAGEWVSGQASYDAAGNVIAYAVGKDQYLKASDDTVSPEKAITGTFDATKGTPLYTINGDKSGKVPADNTYKVSATRWIKGRQAVKIGSNAQWIYADTGAYWPANN